MKITIETIAHEDQRYPTVGDWFYSPAGDLQIKVSSMENEDYELLVAIHELIEAILTVGNGTTQQEVDDFDKSYETSRLPGDDSEPGDWINAPYHNEHVFAGAIERIIAHEMGVEWSEYEKAIAKIG